MWKEKKDWVGCRGGKRRCGREERVMIDKNLFFLVWIRFVFEVCWLMICEKYIDNGVIGEVFGFEKFY